MAFLLYKIVAITGTSCQISVENGLFWHAAVVMASLFFIRSTVSAVDVFCLCISFGLAVFRNANQLFDVEIPEPIPVNHGIEMVANGEAPIPKIIEVTKTDVDGKECLICRENEKTHASIPCGHMCLCALCAEDLSRKGIKGQRNTRCPVCRLEVDNFSRIYH